MLFFQLFIRMLRYRVAIMLFLFYFIGKASTYHFTSLNIVDLFACISLAMSYVAATTINDIADFKIDQINHAKSSARPLVTGEATKRDLILVHIVAVIIVIISALLISRLGVVIMCISILINYMYSVPPFRLSYRTFAAPILLSLAYVGIPFLFGFSTIDSSQKLHILLLFSLLFLFIGRIILKDFRDRKGDAKYHKPTFLLQFGKKITCLFSLCNILIGNVLLFISLHTDLVIFSIFELFFLTIFLSEYMLWKANAHDAEQTAIGLGAKMGNGLLITLLSFLTLEANHAPSSLLHLFLSMLTILYIGNFFFLYRKPEIAVIGYRG